MLRKALRRKNKTENKLVPNIYDEIDRFNFKKEQKSTLLSYFTLNDKAEASAEKALAVCRNYDEKLAYLDKILISNQNSESSPHSSDSISVDDSKMFDEMKEKLNEDNKKNPECLAPDIRSQTENKSCDHRAEINDELIVLQKQLLKYNEETFGRFMQDLTRDHEKRIKENNQLRQDINKMKAQVQGIEKALAIMKSSG